VVRRAGLALRENFSGDVFLVARRALEAAFPSEDSVYEVLAGRRVQIRRANGADHVAA
jgi:hypothetical protein